MSARDRGSPRSHRARLPRAAHRRRDAASVLGVAALLLVAGARRMPAQPGTAPPIELSLPLPPDLPATGSFGEYREGHLHAGIDFSTRGELGWPVQAAADGEVYRVKVERRGYGRAVYLRHARGYETVYGHLHRLDDETLGLERFVAAERTRLGDRYPGDLYLDPPLPVRRGQVIALSGESGGGLPHLHFELRHLEEPVDPVRAGMLAPAGFAAPVIEELWVLPRGPCQVDGRWAPARFPFVRGDDRFRLETAPEVAGSFDLELTAHVPGGGRMGLAEIDLQCNGERRFRADLRRFSFEQYRESGLLYDEARSLSSGGRYTYRLRAPAAMSLPGVEGAGLAEPPPGDLGCAIAVADARGNAARAELTLRIRPAPAYAAEPPAGVASWDLFDRLLLLNGAVALDPLHLAPEAAAVAGMPAVHHPGRRAARLQGPGGIELHLQDGSLYEPAPIALSAEPSAPRPPIGLEPIRPAVRLAPAGLFLRRDARWRARADDPERAAFYRYDPLQERWECLGRIVADGWIEGEARTGGTYALLRDGSPPRITGVQLRDEPRLGQKRLVFPVVEAGEGIDVDAFEVSLNGSAVEAEYDPDRDWGQAWLPASRIGRIRVSAMCRDRAGNRSNRFDATVEARAAAR